VLTEIPITRTGGRSTKVGNWASIAAHGVLLVLLILGGRHAWKSRPVTARGGAHATVLYWANSVGTGIARSHQQGAEKLSPARLTPRTSPVNRTPQKALDPEVQETAQSVPASPAGGSISQSQSSGAGDSSEDATPAFPVYSPTPRIADRSLLPKADENVVVDVNVSALGEVLDEKLIHGLGNSIDQTILDTVRSWKFHPATVDGNAVASVAELVFPLNQKWHG
jgi:hypothetical protein